MRYNAFLLVHDQCETNSDAWHKMEFFELNCCCLFCAKDIFATYDIKVQNPICWYHIASMKTTETRASMMLQNYTNRYRFAVPNTHSLCRINSKCMCCKECFNCSLDMCGDRLSACNSIWPIKCNIYYLKFEYLCSNSIEGSKFDYVINSCKQSAHDKWHNAEIKISYFGNYYWNFTIGRFSTNSVSNWKNQGILICEIKCFLSMWTAH